MVLGLTSSSPPIDSLGISARYSRASFASSKRVGMSLDCPFGGVNLDSEFLHSDNLHVSFQGQPSAQKGLIALLSDPMSVDGVS